MTLLKFAEILDSLRIFPRVLLVAYVVSVAIALQWYFDFEVKYVEKCDSSVLSTLLMNKVPVEQARDMACSEVDVIAQPMGYTALMSTLVGAGAAIYAAYSASGRKWHIEGTK